MRLRIGAVNKVFTKLRSTVKTLFVAPKKLSLDIKFGWLEAVALPLPRLASAKRAIPNREVKRCTADDTHFWGK